MNNAIKTVSAKLVAGTMAMVMSFALVAPAASADSSVDALQAQINALLAQLNALNGDDNNSSNATAGSYVHQPNTAFEFTRNLYLGARGTDVMMLQKALNENSSTQVATTGAGSAGNETEFFGPATKNAVAKFQVANGITPAAGYFYPLTRTEMNRKNAGSVSTGNNNDDSSSNDGDLEVSETNDADEGDFTNGVTRYLATSFEIEADDDATIEGITVRYSGRADEDDIIENLILTDADGNLLAEEEDLDSDAEAEFDNLRIDLEDGDSIEVYVHLNAVNNENNFEAEDGLDFEIQVIEIEADGDVDGLPLTGPEHTIQDVEVGDVDVDIENEGGSIEIGEEGELIATVEVDSNPEDSDDSVFLNQIRIENIGSGDLTELEDIYAELDGEDYEGVVDEFDEDFVIFDFDGYEIEDGDSEDIEIRATAVEEAGDDFEFDIDADEAYNVHVEHEDGYGMQVNITTSGTAVSVEEGSLSVASSDDDESDEVSAGNDIFLGEFEIDIDGEDLEIDEMRFVITLATGDVVTNDTDDIEDLLLEDVYLEDEDGNRVTDTEDAEWVGGTPGALPVSQDMEVEFDNVDLEEGDDVTYKVFATIDDNVDNGSEYNFEISASDITGIEGTSSDEDITATGGTVTMEERTVEAADLEVSISSSPTSRTIEDDEDDTVFAKFQFDATDSGEDLELRSFEAEVAVTGVAADLEKLTNCRLYDEDDNEVELDRDVDGDDASGFNPGVFEFQFENDLLLEKDTVTTLELRCDIGSLANGVDFTWELDGSEDVNAEGAETNNDVNATVNAGSAGTMTIGDAELQVLEDASSPSTQLVVEGTEVILGVLEIEAEDGEVTVEDIEVTLTGTSETLVDEEVVIEVDGVEVGIATFTSSNNDIVEDIDVIIEDDESVELVFKAMVSSVGDDEDADNGTIISLAVDDVTPEDGSVTVNGLASAIAFDDVYVYESVPSVAQVSFSDENVELTSGGNRELLRFSVSADDAGDITLGAMQFDITGDVARIDAGTMEVEVFTSSSMSNKVATHDGDFLVNEATGDVSFKDDNTDTYLEVPEGETYYFRVTADLSSVVDGDEISVSLVEDATFATAAINATDAVTVFTGNGTFIWTPDFNVSGTSDYFNGFEVEGMDADIQATRINEN